MSIPPAHSTEELLLEQFKTWQKQKDPNVTLKWKDIDPKEFLIRFEFSGKTIPVGYPADEDGMFFMDTGAVTWGQRFNEHVMSKDNAQLADVLNFMLETLNKEKQGILTKSMEYTQVPRTLAHTHTRNQNNVIVFNILIFVSPLLCFAGF